MSEKNEFMFFTRVSTRKVRGTYKTSSGERQVKVYEHKIVRIPPELGVFFEDGEEVLVTIKKVKRV